MCDTTLRHAEGVDSPKMKPCWFSHAKSSWNNTALDDRERPLNKGNAVWAADGRAGG